MQTPLLVFDQNEQGVYFDFEAFLSTRLLIQGTSRAGKTHMLRYILEAYAGKVPQLIIDWEGELHTLKEAYEGYVWVGDLDNGADLAARPETARRHCRELMVAGGSVIVDLSDVRDLNQRYEIAKLWLDELMHLPKEHWRVRLVVIPEVQKFCPEGVDVPSSAAVRDVFSNGGKRGVVPIVDTQRLAKVDKSITDVGNFLIGRTTADVDLDRAVKQLGFRTDQRSSLKELQRGHFYAYGIAIGDGNPVLVRSAEKTKSFHKDVLRGMVQAPPSTGELAKALLAMRTTEGVDVEGGSRQELTEEIERLRKQLSAAIAGNTSDPADIRRAVETAVAPKDAEIHDLRVQVEAIRAYARLILTTSGELIEDAQNKKDDHDRSVNSHGPSETEPKAGSDVPEEVQRMADRIAAIVKRNPQGLEVVAKRAGTTTKSSHFRRAIALLKRTEVINVREGKAVKA